MLLRSRRVYRFPVEADFLWSRLGAVDQYRLWWPWLRSLEAGGFTPGAKWSCTVKPPLPWSVRLVLLILEVDEAVSVTALVEGDIQGRAQLKIRSTSAGSELELQSELSPNSAFLRTAGRLAGPVSRFGHDWILDTGLRQFQAHLGHPGP